ncbi:MAG: glycosyltransferase, partial [Candidatus Eremiobacteraeota bacterium]|nr:glycosyltransferase [Candidatus Eremiobacteraeota bacterium]
LRARNARIAFVGTADRFEASIVPKAGYELIAVASRSLERRSLGGAFRTLFVNLAGTCQSLRTLRRLRPDIVIATGGYVCFPVVLAARMLRLFALSRCAIVLLEPNARPGLTNRLLAPLVDEVWGAFADADRRFASKYVKTGVPVRAALRALPERAHAIAALGLDARRQTIFAMGGSQGARTINDALVALVRDEGVPPGWQVALVSGERDFAAVREGLRGRHAVARAYLDDPSEGYAAADLVVARAGASTLAELAATGKPAILVPYPFASDDHQAANAARYAASGAAVVVGDAAVQDGALRAVIAETSSPARMETLRAAAERLRTSDPLATILGRVDWLIARK